MTCSQRLQVCHDAMQKVNKSWVPRLVFPWILNLMSFYIRPIAQFGLYNRNFATSISNLPIPSSEEVLVNNKYPIVDMDYAIGPCDGVNGIETIYF